MSEAFFRDYYWANGSPRGLDLCSSPETGVCYKIIKDPYGKRISLELYQKGQLQRIAYDSIFLDFRKLKPREQVGWEKHLEKSDDQIEVYLICNQEGRAILREVLYFDQQVCRETRIFNLWNERVSTHQIWFKKFDDPFDGVILFDIQGKPVMYKKYTTGHSGQFEDLLEEQWDMKECTWKMRSIIPSNFNPLVSHPTYSHSSKLH